jgi:molybdate transport system substrate-binding protein
MWRWITLVFLLAGAAVPPLPAQDLTISAAVSLKEAIGDIAVSYRTSSGGRLQLNFAATGLLLAQIREGAPVDVFIAASEAQMDQAAAQKLIDPASRRVIAINSLVLIVPADSKLPLQGFADLGRADLKRLALGEPKTVPAGDYATQVLEHLRLDDVLKSKLVKAASVRQVLDYVERGEVDAGIVYATDAQQSGSKVKVITTADPSWHQPIHYPAAVVAASKQHDAAAAFIDYLTTEPAQALLRKRGFAAPTTQPAAGASTGPAGG